MKRLVLLAVCLVAWAGVPSSMAAHPHGAARVSFGLFHSSLASYGAWVYIDAGVRAWRPMHVPAYWRPYTVGRWVWTDDGWYWLSDEPWGWAVYHYGRWEYDDAYGWIWIPGYDWAPAWVEWRIGPSYIGWAPLGMAAVFEAGYGLRFAHSWVARPRCWTFVDIRYVDAPDVYRHAYPAGANGRYLARTVRGGDIGYERGRIVTHGPSREYVEGKTGRSVRRGALPDVSDRMAVGERRERERETPNVYRPGGEGRAAERYGVAAGAGGRRDAGWNTRERSRNVESGRKSVEGEQRRESLRQLSVPERAGRPNEAGRRADRGGDERSSRGERGRRHGG